MVLTTFPDAHFTIEDMVGEGDKVVSRFTVGGTHRGEMLGIAPTGKAMVTTGTITSRLVDGKVAEEWENLDYSSMLVQLGAVVREGLTSLGPLVDRLDHLRVDTFAVHQAGDGECRFILTGKELGPEQGDLDAARRTDPFNAPFGIVKDPVDIEARWRFNVSSERGG